MTKPVVPTTSIFSVRPVRQDTDHLPLLDPTTYMGAGFMEVFATAVSRARIFGSTSEAYFVGWLANRLPVALIDGAGNLHVDLRTSDQHRSMFTAHTDTAHDRGGPNAVRVDGNIWRAEKDSCLGADDAAGVAILYHMIMNNVPGYYVFFRGEECGGLGSSWLAKEMPWLFEKIDRAVAFDRAGYCDVITHQRGGRCCSDVFAQTLADALSTETDWFLPDPTGVYTDTAEFTRLIPECTNISVGYKNQHGDREEQDVEFLQKLAAIVLTVPWDELPTVRNPKVREYAGEYGPLTSADRFMLSTVAWDDDGEFVPDTAPAVRLDIALDSALYDDDFRDLLDLIAAEISPEAPELAIHHISRNKLTVQVLEEALDALDRGEDPGYQLQILANECLVV